MSIWLAIAAVAGIATLFVWCALAVAGSADDDAVALQQLAARARHHHPLRNHGEGDGVGEIGVGRLHNDRSQ